MSTEREQLGRSLYVKAEAHLPNVESRWDQETPGYRESYARMADAVLEAGYRKPRTVTTVEELDALGKGSVVLDADGDSFQFDGDYWRLAGYGDNFRGHEIPFPATVLHEATS